MQKDSRFIITALLALIAASLACGGGSDDSNELRTGLHEHLPSSAIREVEFSGGDLLISTRLDRTNLETFYSQIGAIHGVVVAQDPDVRRVILDDATGQRIIIPMEDMRRFHRKSITFDEFRNSWTVINPSEARPTNTPGRPKRPVDGWLCDWDSRGEVTLWDSPSPTDRSETAAISMATEGCVRAWSVDQRIVDGVIFYYVSDITGSDAEGWVDVDYFYPSHIGKPDWSK